MKGDDIKEALIKDGVEETVNEAVSQRDTSGQSESRENVPAAETIGKVIGEIMENRTDQRVDSEDAEEKNDNARVPSGNSHGPLQDKEKNEIQDFAESGVVEKSSEGRTCQDKLVVNVSDLRNDEIQDHRTNELRDVLNEPGGSSASNIGVCQTSDVTEKLEQVVDSLATQLSDPPNDDVDEFYQIKTARIKSGQAYSFLLQNKNGPCPLLAIINLLLLQGINSLLSDESISNHFVGKSEILQRLSNLICDRSAKAIRRGPASLSLNLERTTEEVLSILPSLFRGLDVNCRFSGPHAFEFTRELSIFDLLQIPLVHGWVASKDEPKILQSISYNQAVDYAVRHSEVLILISDIASLAGKVWEKRKKCGKMSTPLPLSLKLPPLLPSELPSQLTPPLPAEIETPPAHLSSKVSLPPPFPFDELRAPQPLFCQTDDRLSSQTTGGYNDQIYSTDQTIHDQTIHEISDHEINAIDGSTVANDSSSVIREFEIVEILRSEFERISIQKKIVDEIIASIAEHVTIGSDKTTDENDVEKCLHESVTRFWEIVEIIFKNRDSYARSSQKLEEAEDSSKIGFTEFLTQGCQIKSFLEQSSNQLTLEGFHLLHDCLPDNKMSVLFRNDHFTVIYNLEGAVYQLVTDVGFSDVRNIMWERLDDISGNTTFFDAEFYPSNLQQTHQSRETRYRTDRADDVVTTDQDLAQRLQRAYDSQSSSRYPVVLPNTNSPNNPHNVLPSDQTSQRRRQQMARPKRKGTKKSSNCKMM